jgi:hypothetical protein
VEFEIGHYAMASAVYVYLLELEDFNDANLVKVDEATFFAEDPTHG